MAIVNLGTGVKPSTDASRSNEIAGAVILAGQVVYRDATDGSVKLASTASANASKALGVALNSAPTVGQPVVVQWSGVVSGTATLIVGEPYFVSDTAGSVGQATDVGLNDFVTFVGIALTATTLRLGILASGVQHA